MAGAMLRSTRGKKCDLGVGEPGGSREWNQGACFRVALSRGEAGVQVFMYSRRRVGHWSWGMVLWLMTQAGGGTHRAREGQRRHGRSGAGESYDRFG